MTGLVQKCHDRWIHPENGDNSPGSKVGDVPDEPRQWRAFELADLMEQGLTVGLTSTFIPAPKDPSIEERFCVERSLDRQEWLVTRQDGEGLLLARANNNDGGYRIFVARDGQPPTAFGPAFLLTTNDKRDKWTLQCPTCDVCESRGRRKCGTRELAHITHFAESIGEGQIFCMDMKIPELHEDDSCAPWCPVCSSAAGISEESSMILTTRRPKWNPRRKSLSLDFFGRCSLASAKNFQLQFADKPGKVKLLFGKVATNSFVLDFKRPLGLVQAFAAAVSAADWK